MEAVVAALLKHCQVAIKNNNLHFLFLTRTDFLFFFPSPLPFIPLFGSTYPNRGGPCVLNQQFLLAN
jgi:hypothetical protein